MPASLVTLEWNSRVGYAVQTFWMERLLDQPMEEQEDWDRRVQETKVVCG